MESLMQEKQDLSVADKQELLAFVEKRDWFEAKLESLKLLEPVYPYIHPILLPNADGTGYKRRGSETSPWSLPSRAQLNSWVKERDVIEDEVDRFDGGDMERMKEKTRQVTRVPLTQPSTDLVEVSLDLILVIDQLLQALRQRGAALDIAILRLQWDDIRWEIGRASGLLKDDIDQIVMETCRWTPSATSIEGRSTGKHIELHSSSSSSMALVSGSSPGSSFSNLLSQSLTSLSDIGTLEVNEQENPIPFSLFRSQLLSLQMKERNFATTLVERSGAILDRIIDSAAHLSGLGGINGPLEEDAVDRGGVIPEELIEIQDELETQAKDIHERVEWCQQFEMQCKQALEHFSVSNRSHRAVKDILAELEMALTVPASSERHAHLAQLFATVAATLSPPTIDVIIQPSHRAYRAKDEHNEVLIQILDSARQSVHADSALAEKGISFYRSLLNARDALRAQQIRVSPLRRDLIRSIDRIEKGTPDRPRPVIDHLNDPSMGHEAEIETWVASIPEWLAEGDVLARTAIDMQQASTLAVMRYRKALTPPLAIRYLIPNGVVDDFTIDDDDNDIALLAKRYIEVAQSVRIHAKAISSLVAIRFDISKLTSDAIELCRAAACTVHEVAWPSCDSRTWSDTDFSGQLAEQNRRLLESETELTRLSQLLGQSTVTQLVVAWKQSRDRLRETGCAISLISCLVHQGDVVKEIQNEADNLVASIDAAHIISNHSKSSAMLEVKRKIIQWDSGLVQRVPLVSEAINKRPNEGRHEISTASVLPTLSLTPTLIDLEDDHPDLAEIDARVRIEVSSQSARVASALDHLLESFNSDEEESCSSQAAEEIKSAEDATLSISTTLGELTHHPECQNASQGQKKQAVGRYGSLSVPQGAPVETKSVNEINFTVFSSPQDAFIVQDSSDVTGCNKEWQATADVAPLEGSTKCKEAEKFQEDIASQCIERRDEVITYLDGRRKGIELESISIQEKTECAPVTISQDNVVALSNTDSPHAFARAAVANSNSNAKLENIAGGSSRYLERASGFGENAILNIERYPTKAADVLNQPEPLIDQNVRVADGTGHVARMWEEVQQKVQKNRAAVDLLSVSLLTPTTSTAKTVPRITRRIPSAALPRSGTLHPARATSQPMSPSSGPTSLDKTASTRIRTVSTPGKPANISSNLTRQRHESTLQSSTVGLADISKIRHSPADSKSSAQGTGENSGSGSGVRGRAPRVSVGNMRSVASRSERARENGSSPPASLSPLIPTPLPAQETTLHRLTQRRVKSTYVADVTSALDRAVANVVNTFDVNVPIIPIGPSTEPRDSPTVTFSPGVSSHEWKDESGRYWIGSGSRARLCFCRILRSRTVMVRVGGGWVELSRFLLDHFSDSVGRVDLATTQSATPEVAAVPLSPGVSNSWPTLPVESSSLAASGLLEAPTSLPRTPTRTTQPLFRTPEHQSASALSKSMSRTSLGRSEPSSANGPGSPLLAMSFLRRASESPSVREREREGLRAGRHSLLRETSADDSTAFKGGQHLGDIDNDEI